MGFGAKHWTFYVTDTDDDDDDDGDNTNTVDDDNVDRSNDIVGMMALVHFFKSQKI